MVIPADAPVVLIAPDAAVAAKAGQDLKLVGIDNVMGYLLAPGPESKLIKLKMLSPEELQGQKECTIVDVRTPAEWDSGHIPGAIHHELAKAARSLSEIPRGAPIAVVCARGNRASVIASLLQKEGEFAVANVRGGMTAWQKAGLPVVAE
jgi:hydroxyacylglutathione hydrolase